MNDRTWGGIAPQCPPLDWRALWSDERHGRWQVEEATRESDGWTRPNLRLVMGDEERRLTGAMCVCVRRDGPQPRVLLVEQDRPAPGVRLWEVPSGMVDEEDATPAESALRELSEETGVEARFVADLGEIYPDPGVFAASVQVVVAEAGPAEADSPRRTGGHDVTGDGDGGNGSGDAGEGPEVERTGWFTQEEIDTLIATGRLRCGISLAALTLARTWRNRNPNLDR